MASLQKIEAKRKSTGKGASAKYLWRMQFMHDGFVNDEVFEFHKQLPVDNCPLPVNPACQNLLATGNSLNSRWLMRVRRMLPVADQLFVFGQLSFQFTDTLIHTGIGIRPAMVRDELATMLCIDNHFNRLRILCSIEDDLNFLNPVVVLGEFVGLRLGVRLQCRRNFHMTG